MNKKGELSNLGIGLMLSLFIVAIVAMPLLTEIANQQTVMTTPIAVVNNSISTAPSAVTASGQINTTIQYYVTNYYPVGDYRNTQCPMTAITLTNSTGASYTATTDYVFTPAYGNFTLKNTAKVNQSVLSNNLTYVSYTFCEEGYIPDASTRSITGLITLFAVLALVAVYLKVKFD